MASVVLAINSLLFVRLIGWLVSLSVLKKRNNGPTGLSDRLGVLVSAAFFTNEGEAQGGWPPSTVSFPTERRGAAAKIGSAGRGDRALRPGKPRGLLASSVSRRAPLPVGVRASSRRHPVISGCSLADSEQNSTFDLATPLEGCRGNISRRVRRGRRGKTKAGVRHCLPAAPQRIFDWSLDSLARGQELGIDESDCKSSMRTPCAVA